MHLFFIFYFLFPNLCEPRGVEEGALRLGLGGGHQPGEAEHLEQLLQVQVQVQVQVHVQVQVQVQVQEQVQVQVQVVTWPRVAWLPCLWGLRPRGRR